MGRSWPGLQGPGFCGTTVSIRITHLGSSPSCIHSQSDGESTADDVDFKEGTKEVTAAQGDHLLWGQGLGWWGSRGQIQAATQPGSQAYDLRGILCYKATCCHSRRRQPFGVGAPLLLPHLSSEPQGIFWCPPG